MKKLILLALIFIHFKIFAQNQYSFYLNENFELTRKESGIYICSAKLNDKNAFQYIGNLTITDTSGALIVKSNYNQRGKRHGSFSIFDGEQKLQMKGHYQNGDKSGHWEIRDEITHRVRQFEFQNDNLLRLIDTNEDTLVNAGSGIFKNTTYDSNLSSWMLLSGNILNGQKNGIWEYKITKINNYKKNQTLSSGKGYKVEKTNASFVGEKYGLDRVITRENYENGIFKNGLFFTLIGEEKYTERRIDQLVSVQLLDMLENISIDKQAFNSMQTAQNYIFNMPEYSKEQLIESPKYPGGDFCLNYYLLKNLQYPQKAMNRRIEGTVVVRFTIQFDGTTSNFFIAKSDSKIFNDEAIRVLNNIPYNWFPKQNIHGEPIESEFSLPVTFKLRR